MPESRPSGLHRLTHKGGLRSLCWCRGNGKLREKKCVYFLPILINCHGVFLGLKKKSMKISRIKSLAALCIALTSVFSVTTSVTCEVAQLHPMFTETHSLGVSKKGQVHRTSCLQVRLLQRWFFTLSICQHNISKSNFTD